MSLILSIDPSLSCTGWALVNADATKAVAFGKFNTTESMDLHVRCRLLATNVQSAALDHCKAADIAAVLIETPQDEGNSGRGRRSTTYLPSYGACVGYFLGHFDAQVFAERVHAISASKWGKGFRTGGDNKPQRVKAAAWTYQIKPEDMGKPTVAGNVADALLMARWWADRQRLGGGR